MTQGDKLPTTTTSTVTTTTTTTFVNKPTETPSTASDKAYRYTDTIAAATIAVLAVVIIITMLLVFRALRKRRRARQGEQFDQVQTLTTGIMGAGVAAYSTRLTNVPVPTNGNVSWQSVNPSLSDHQTHTAASSTNPS